MAVDRPQVDRAACAATEAVNIKPWHARHHRCADRGRPQQSSAGGELFVQASTTAFASAAATSSYGRKPAECMQALYENVRLSMVPLLPDRGNCL